MKSLTIPMYLTARAPDGSQALVFQPDVDMEDWTEETQFELKEKLHIEFPGDDNTVWEATGEVVEILDEPGEAFLLLVSIIWSTAVPLHP